MIRSFNIAIALFFGLASGAFAAPDLLTERLTYFGLGPIRLGLTSEQLKNAGFDFTEEPSGSEGCYEARLKTNTKILVMFEDEKVTRVSTYDSNITTHSGARVGVSEKRVRDIYGTSLVVEPHAYETNGHYMIVKSLDGKNALVMETDVKRVTQLTRIIHD